jgi:hypothetical protein
MWLSSFLQMHHRQLFVPTRVEHPGVDIAQINTIISQAWEALTAEERTQFCKQVRRCSAFGRGACSLSRLHGVASSQLSNDSTQLFRSSLRCCGSSCR